MICTLKEEKPEWAEAGEERSNQHIQTEEVGEQWILKHGIGEMRPLWLKHQEEGSIFRCVFAKVWGCDRRWVGRYCSLLSHKQHTSISNKENAPGNIPNILPPVGGRAAAGSFTRATAHGRTCGTNWNHFQTARQLLPKLKLFLKSKSESHIFSMYIFNKVAVWDIISILDLVPPRKQTSLRSETYRWTWTEHPRL